MLILALLAAGLTVWDIRGHEFRDNSSTKWMVLVILFSYIGMMFYYYYGNKQKEPYRFRIARKIKA